jgi:hypothetical protein
MDVLLERTHKQFRREKMLKCAPYIHTTAHTTSSYTVFLTTALLCNSLFSFYTQRTDKVYTIQSFAFVDKQFLKRNNKQENKKNKNK